MRVLVTGATGFIGSAVVPELIGAGHEVVGLARSDASAAALKAADAEVVAGSLDDLDLLRSAARDLDGVLHLAFKHEEAFSGHFPTAAAADRAAIAVFGHALEGTDKPLAIASGLAGHGGGKVLTEDDKAASDSATTERMIAEDQLLALAASGVRAASVRLSPSVHGEGDRAFVAFLISIAREHGVSGYVGDGGHWPAVHRLDAARLFRMALEEAPAGTVLHSAAEEGVPLRDVAEAIGRKLDLPVASIAPEQADAHFGWFAAFAGLDVRASSAQTRQRLGWEPTHPGLIADTEAGHYFATTTT